MDTWCRMDGDGLFEIQTSKPTSHFADWYGVDYMHSTWQGKVWKRSHSIGHLWHGSADANLSCEHLACTIVSVFGLKFKNPSDRCYVRFNIREAIDKRWLF